MSEEQQPEEIPLEIKKESPKRSPKKMIVQPSVKELQPSENSKVALLEEEPNGGIDRVEEDVSIK